MEESSTASVSSLASMLRNAGNAISNKNVKFTLTEDLLNDVIKSFDLVNEKKEVMSSSFHVVHNTIESADVISDIQFLYEFFQKAPTLKLSGSNNINKDSIDLSYFKRLKYVEICNLNLRRLKGLNNFRDMLEILVCTRNIKDLNEIFMPHENVDPDSEDLLWLKLRSAYLSHNNISNIDTSFQYTPYLHTLDLSFNCLENVDNLNYLPNLKNLNMAYNKLKNAPNFYGTICNKLQVLNLKYNFIECILGLSLLVNLRELDLGYNFLLKHDTLVPLANILSLQSLKLKGNPISYHPYHRTNTCNYLHSNTSTVAFYLDGKIMSYKEKVSVGSIHPKISTQRTHLISHCSSAGSAIVDKPRRIREATISDQNDEILNDLSESVASISSLVTSYDHLEKKKTVEELRNKLGEMWLLGDSRISHGSPKKSPQFASTPYDDVLIHAKEFVLSDETFHDAVETTPKTATNESSNETYREATSETPDPYSGGNLCDSASSDSVIDIGTCDDDLYFVTRVGESEQICLVVTEKFLAERDVVVDAKEHYRWDTEGLISCKVDNDVIHLEFDRMRADYKQRQYQLEDDAERERLIKVLTNIIDKRPTQETSVKCYQCLKCNKTFKLQNGKYNKNVECLECPACESKLIIEQKSSN